MIPEDDPRRELAIKALQQYRDVMGESPSFGRWSAIKLAPSARTISNWFGGWTNALSAAGIEPSPSGRRRMSKFDESTNQAKLEKFKKDQGR